MKWIFSRNTVAVLITFIVAITYAYAYDNRLEVDNSFSKISGNMSVHQMAEEAHLKAVVFPLGFEKALVVGRLTLDGENYPLCGATLYKNPDPAYPDGFRLSCQPKERVGYRVGVYINVNTAKGKALKDIVIVRANTSLKTKSIKRETAVYVLTK